MTSFEHAELSSFIKSIHKKLRDEAKILGTDQAWKMHTGDMENLAKYASAMQQLAINHWDKNCKKDQKVISRVFWVYEACKDYFLNINKYRDRELHIKNSYFSSSDISLPVISVVIPECTENVKYKLLDVGSCYNPFKQFNIFDVLPIDIAPATSEVQTCDFLNLNISQETMISDNKVIQLKENSFDIVVFSLLLEYLPSPDQRLKSCLNAFMLLKSEGILAIITPDSNHVGSNAKIFKSWRYVLAKHGFIRVKYEKLPYLHCMVFRKACYKVVAERWAEVHESEGFFEKIFIPQDFKETKTKEIDYLDKQNEWTGDTFLEKVNWDISC